MKTYNIVVLFFFSVAVNMAQGVIRGQNILSIDFTDSNDAKTKAVWSDPEKIGITEEGLGWDGKENAS